MLVRHVRRSPRGDAILATREILQVGIVTSVMLPPTGRCATQSSKRGVAFAALVVTARVDIMVCAIILTQGNGNAFIYFQF